MRRLKMSKLMFIAGIVLMLAVLFVVGAEAQNTYVNTPQGTYVIQAVPSGVDSNGVPLGVDSGKGRDSYTNYNVIPPMNSRDILDSKSLLGGSGHKTKRVVIEVDDDD
jgi:hypothetical protein